VSRLELLLQVGTFCSALGALVAGNDTFPLSPSSFFNFKNLQNWSFQLPNSGMDFDK
jgi:hypothetical protein